MTQPLLIRLMCVLCIHHHHPSMSSLFLLEYSNGNFRPLIFFVLPPFCYCAAAVWVTQPVVSPIKERNARDHRFPIIAYPRTCTRRKKRSNEPYGPEWPIVCCVSAFLGVIIQQRSVIILHYKRFVYFFFVATDKSRALRISSCDKIPCIT